MIHAYDESYLAGAQRVLAHMLDCAVNQYEMDLETFYALFLISSVADRFQNGDCAVIAGRSGAELFEEVMAECGAEHDNKTMSFHEERSREYWTGWALAYYQWHSGLTFMQIDKAVQIKIIRDMHTPYHEMDIRLFCDEMDRRMKSCNAAETRLGYYRKKLGMSQRQLAEAAEIPVRTIQQYEQRQKDINRAQSAYVLRLSKVLGCSQQELSEL